MGSQRVGHDWATTILFPSLYQQAEDDKETETSVYMMTMPSIIAICLKNSCYWLPNPPSIFVFSWRWYWRWWPFEGITVFLDIFHVHKSILIIRHLFSSCSSVSYYRDSQPKAWKDKKTFLPLCVAHQKFKYTSKATANWPTSSSIFQTPFDLLSPWLRLEMQFLFLPGNSQCPSLLSIVFSSYPRCDVGSWGMYLTSTLGFRAIS